MNTMYTKSALKKIKKDDLVQMYLDLQAKNYDDKMEEVLEKCCNNAIDETVKELQKENEKLKKRVSKVLKNHKECVGNKVKIIMDLKRENEKLKEWSLSAQMIEDTSAETIEEFEQDVRDAWAEGTLDGREEEIEKLKEEVDTWHKALDEKVEGLEHLQSEINLHFWRRCKGPWDTNVEKINQDHYEDDEVDYYVDAGRKAVLKDGRIVMSKD